MPPAAELQARHHRRRDTQPDSLRIRIHRALSWLQQAERARGGAGAMDDPDAEFLFLWIAFNAVYASELCFERGERQDADAFVAQVVALDRDGRLQEALFRQFTGPVRNLVENRFVFEPYWRAMREHDASGAWEVKFTNARKNATAAVLEKRTEVLLAIVLDRLHVLRNQLVHGGVACGSPGNRALLRDGAMILRSVVPTVVDLLIDLDDDPVGSVAYPYVHA